jgi:hypothetical protein
MWMKNVFFHIKKVPKRDCDREKSTEGNMRA